jgi:hypothetical protein
MRNPWLWLMLAALPVTVAADDFPPAPKGFAWKQFDKVKTILLVPDGWHVKEKEEKGTRAIFITEKEIKGEEKYDVGLSVNIVRELKGKSAPAVARSTIAELSKQHKLVRSWSKDAGKLKGFGCLVRAEAPDKSGPLMMHCLAFGNTETNTFYLFVFEAPADKWEKAWEQGEVLMQKLGIDDEV